MIKIVGIGGRIILKLFLNIWDGWRVDWIDVAQGTDKQSDLVNVN
jgi:hypothetical protein